MLILKKEFLEQIISQSKREAPNEACGILAGREGKVDPSTSLRVNGEHSRTVEKVYEMTNRDKSPSTYFMDAKEQLKVMKEMRNLGLEMVGIYHSHVASAAYPSAHDVELAFYPDVAYLIISLKDRDNPDIRSFKIVEGKVTEEEIKIC